MSRKGPFENEMRARSAGSAPGAVSFLCECREPACHAHITLSAAALRQVRARADQIVVAPSHQGPQDQLVESHSHYSVIRTAVRP